MNVIRQAEFAKAKSRLPLHTHITTLNPERILVLFKISVELKQLSVTDPFELMFQGNRAGVSNENGRGGPCGPPRKSFRIRQRDASVFLGVGFK